MASLLVRWLVISLDTSLKAALLALVAAGVISLLRLSDSNLRHRVWTGVLAGMLLLPALTPLVPALHLPLVPAADSLLAWTSAAAEEEALVMEAEPIASEHPVTTRLVDSLETGPYSAPTDHRFASAAALDRPQLSPAESPPDVIQPPELPPIADAIATATPTPELASRQLPAAPAFTLARISLIGLAALGLIGSLLLVLRLALGLWLAVGLRRYSTLITATGLPKAIALPTSSCIRESDRIRVPLTVGILRPQILLPVQWRNWPASKLHAVLAHEQTHVERGDCLVAMLAEINCCLFWFHPLAWWLKRQLAALAEQACDDAAIDSIGNRTQYARHLLDVAADVSQHQGRFVPAGVSMARASGVESRILAILDFTRPLSRRLTWPAALVLMLVMAVLIVLAAALRPAATAGQRGEPDRPTTSAADEASGQLAVDGDQQAGEAPKPPLDDMDFTFAGTTVDDKGQLLAGVALSLRYGSKMPAGDDVKRLAVSDEQGRFELTTKIKELLGLGQPRPWAGAKLLASKEGYGFGAAPLAYLETSGRLAAELNDRERRIVEYHFGQRSPQIVLAADDVPVRGRIVDSEGRPVAGAKIVPVDVWRGKNGTLDEWLAATALPRADEATAEPHLLQISESGRYTTGELHAPHAHVLPTVQSDADGRFTLKGLGHERIVELLISGPGIATMSLRARSRPGEAIRIAQRASTLDDGPLVFHPADFTCVATPSVPVEGRVTDQHTGQPVADALVLGHKIATNPVHGGFEAASNHTRTDADGRFRLEGLPLGKNIFQVTPQEKSSYLTTQVAVTTELGDKPAAADATLRRGVVVRGRVADTRTGKPVSGGITYFAFHDNPHLRTPGLRLSSEPYQVDAEGRFEIPVLPGPGMLTFNASTDEGFPRGAGADKIEGPKSVTNAVFFRTVPYLVMAGNYSLLTAINPAEDAVELTVDLSLTSGRTLACRIRRADGRPLGKYYLYGQQAFAGWFYDSSGGSFQVQGYFPQTGRRVMVYHPDGNLVGWQDLTGEAPDQFEIVLQPGGKLTGRIVDEDGSPLEGLSIGSAWGDFLVDDRYSPAVAKTWGELPSNLDGRQTLTDASGRFELAGAIPGLVYSGAVSGPAKVGGRMQLASLGRVFETISVESGQTKDLGDLRAKKREPGQQESKSQSDDKPREPPPSPAAAKTQPASNPPENAELRGRVVDADGKPVAGAKLHGFRGRVADVDPMQPRLIATTNAAGEFSLGRPAVPPVDPDAEGQWRSRDWIVISAPGHGFVVTSEEELRRRPGESRGLLGNVIQAIAGNAESTVRLPAAGETIRGRLVDIDGRPVAGATVKIRWFVDIAPGRPNRDLGDVDKVNWQQRVNDLLRVIEPVQLRDLLPQATTDTSGRFELRDLGPNRLFQLLVQSEQTESIDLVARNLSGELITIPPERNFRDHEVTLLPREFDRALGPSKPVSGRVVDLDTGAPVASAVVRAYAVHGNRLHSSRERQEFATSTDADGRYRITGLPIGNENYLAAFALGDVPYIPISHQIDTSKSGDIQQDFRLKRGMWATGRVYDADTDKPFVGQISYYWFRNRDLEQQIPGLRNAFVDELYWTNNNGEFRLPVLTTRGILAFRYAGIARDRDGIDRFARGAGADSIEGGEAMGALKHFPTLPSFLIPVNYERVAEVNPESGQATVRVDLPLFSSPPVKLRVVDAEGNAVAGCEVYGANERWGWRKQQSAEFSLEDLRAGERRKVLAFHRLINMAGGAIVKRDDKQPIEIKLAPAGSITGRLVDTSGDPITDAELHANYDKLKTDDQSGIWAEHPKLFSNPTHIPVDESGRFQLDGLIPGWSYNAYATAPRKLNGQMIRNLVIGTVFQDVRPSPGEKKDLGDLVVREERPEAQPAAKPEAPVPNAPQAVRINGRITDPAGKPLAAAHVAVVGWPTEPQEGVENAPRAEIIAAGKTDDAGRFQLSLPKVSPKSHEPAFLIARGEKTAVAWQKLNFSAPQGQIALKLQPEEPVRVRLVDLEGRPAAGARLEVGSVMKRTNGEWSEDGVGYGGESTHPAWIAPLIADQEGRFTIHGLARDQGIWLYLEASDRFSPQGIAVNTGLPEQRPERDATYRDIVRNAKPGEELIVPLAPAQVFEGTIRYEDTLEPVPHVRVSVRASQQRGGGSMSSVEGKTDAAGHYRISAHPGIRFGVMAYAPTGTAYLIRRTTEDIRWENGDRVRQQDLTLPPGVLIRGKALTAGSGQPVANAAVQFIPQNSAARPPMPGIVTGWQGMQYTDKDGSFQIAAPPGPGHLLVSHDTGSYILQEIGSLALDRGQPGGERNYAHSIQKIDPAPDARSLDLTVELLPGTIVAGRIVDPQGQPIDEALVVSRLHIWSHWLSWHGNGGRSGPATGGRFQLKGLKEGIEYPTHFLDPERRLGATVNLKAGEAEPTIVLQPCGSATVRFVDDKGQPLADHRPNVDFIVTPGAHRYDYEALRAGQLAADADFAANIDRTNHGDLKTDADGKLTIPALIPGATYAISNVNKGRWQNVKEFQVRSGETLDLGEVVLATAKE